MCPTCIAFAMFGELKSMTIVSGFVVAVIPRDGSFLKLSTAWATAVG
jgi:hypothetical protein